MTSFPLSLENTIPLLEYRNLDIREAHKQLGDAVANQVQSILARRFGEISNETITQLQARARSRLYRIGQLREDRTLPARIRDALGLYLDCLETWADGAGLGLFGLNLGTPLELAVLLQDDHPGCQSGVVRGADGSILFWHTEEDVDEPGFARVDQPRLAVFRNPFDGESIFSFIYPDLLPGPNFNWRGDGYVQFADSLFFRDHGFSEGVAANLVTWVTLLLGGTSPAPEIIRSLLPVYEGYALFSLFPRQKSAFATRTEFTSVASLTVKLDAKPSAALLQTNAFSAEARELAARYERDPFRSKKHYQNRIARAERCLTHGENDPTLETIRRMLASREGGKWAFANQDVKAHLYGRLSKDSLEIHSHPGMAPQISTTGL